MVGLPPFLHRKRDVVSQVGNCSPNLDALFPVLSRSALVVKWCAWRELNPQPAASEAVTLSN
jgi:hypothetical protein